jgi:hypothetical protein
MGSGAQVRGAGERPDEIGSRWHVDVGLKLAELHAGCADGGLFPPQGQLCENPAQELRNFVKLI